MKNQLRIYTIKPGEMKAWIEEWNAKIAPLRRRHGFEVVGSWTVDGEDRFVWILGHKGPESWADADAAYYGSPERKAMSPDPARHIAAQEHHLMSPAV
ncbi:MAG: NIPSNAP family containing protein [Chloroflexi bacterium]|nr:MAG: NIPSNAP family containing protein [Chloroflexota bacterium]